jgi:hypothetical protein
VNFSDIPKFKILGCDIESACSHVAVMERLLHETLASVGQNILRPIRVSLQKERKSCLCASGFLHTFSSPPVLCFCNFYPRAALLAEVTQAREAAVATEAARVTAVFVVETSA